MPMHVRFKSNFISIVVVLLGVAIPCVAHYSAPKPPSDQPKRRLDRQLSNHESTSIIQAGTQSAEPKTIPESAGASNYPFIDIRTFGAYLNADNVATTASCETGSSKIILSSPADYSNGQGVVLYRCGSPPSLKTPGEPTITPNLSDEKTKWSYKLIAEDYSGGYTSAGQSGSTEIGPQKLGLNTFAVHSASRSNGISVYTTSIPHKLTAGSSVNICGFGGSSCDNQSFGDIFNGTKVVASVLSPNTFTANDGNVPDATETPANAKGRIKACNTLRFAPGTASGKDRMLRYWIYRARGSEPFTLAGVAIGLDPFFVDCGGNPPKAPSYIPVDPPSRPGAGYLATTIASGGGTSKLTLAASARSSTSLTPMLHDNSSALILAMRQAQILGGGTIYLAAPETKGASWIFNAATDFTAVGGPSYTTILVNGDVALAQPWILRANMRIEGMTRRNSSFMYPGGAHFTGGYPLLYIKHAQSIVLRNLLLNCGGSQCTDLFSDTDGHGGGSVGVISENVGFGNSGNANQGTARNVVIKGGFDFIFRQSTCDPSPGMVQLPSPCVNFTDSSVAVEPTSQISGLVRFYNFFTGGSGIQIDSIPNSNAGGGSSYSFIDVLAESMLTPFLRVGPLNESTNDFQFENLVVADQVSGAGTPLIDVSGARVAAITLARGVTTQNGGQPIVIGSKGYAPTLFSVYQPTLNSGNGAWFALRQNGVNGPAGTSSVVELNNEPLTALGTGRFNSAMLAPEAPTSCVLAPGASIPAGTHTYSLTAVDYDGYETLPGAPATLATNGNQSVECLFPKLPIGAAGFNVYRDGFRIFAGGTCQSPQMQSGKFIDVNRGCGESAPKVNLAGSSSLSQSGISSFQIRISGERLSSAPRSVLPGFFPGKLTSRWTAMNWTIDKGIIVTRIQVQLKIAPAECETNALIRLKSEKHAIDVAIAGSATDSGPLHVDFASGESLKLSVETPASKCKEDPADASVLIQYKMQ